MAVHITSGTTTANTVTTVTFSTWFRGIEVINRSSSDMWARFDTVDPTIAGDECFFIPAQSYIDVSNPLLPPEVAIGTTSNTVIKLITATNADYTVQVGV
jgi:hypothetical protein